MLKTESIEVKNKTIINKLELSDGDFETKRVEADKKLKLYLNKLKKFTNNMELHNDKQFQDTVKNLAYQFMCLQKYNITLTKKMELRHSLLKVMLDENGHEVIVDILELLLSTLLAAPANEVNRALLNPTQKLMDTLMNYSDLSELFGVKLCQMDKLMRLYHQIQSILIPPCLKDEITESHVRLLRASISTLYNTLLYDNPDNLVTIRSYQFFDNIKLLLGNKRERLQLSALLFVVYVADESDSTVFRTNHKSITYLLNLLDKAIHNKYQISGGLKTLELARGIEKLSKNDENKQLLVDLGIMPHLKSLLTSEYVKHKETGLLILWSLAFDERNRLMINETMGKELDDMDEFIKLRQQGDTELQDNVLPSVPREVKEKQVGIICDEDDDNQNDNDIAGLLPLDGTKNRKTSNIILNRVKENKVKEIEDQEESNEGGDEHYVADDSIKYSTLKDLLNCNNIMNGLRWTLKDIKKDIPHQKSDDSQHIMISYSWANADRVMSIYDSLIKRGYKVWIDKFNMADTENIMESMAIAVEKSCAVITCISSSYKDSANCRAEAQYAVKIKKTLVPVIVQKKYRPDGWLGFCTVGLQYCDFEGRYTFEQAFDNLLQQIKRIFGTNNKETKDYVDKVEPVTSKPTSSSNSTQSKIKQWTYKDVIDWFKQIGLTKWEWNQEHNGAELVFLSDVARISPNTLFDICRNEIGLSDLRDLRIFYENILKL